MIQQNILLWARLCVGVLLYRLLWCFVVALSPTLPSPGRCKNFIHRSSFGVQTPRRRRKGSQCSTATSPDVYSLYSAHKKDDKDCSPPPTTSTSSTTPTPTLYTTTATGMSRRNAAALAMRCGSIAATSMTLLFDAPEAHAITPLSSEELDQWTARLERQFLRPKPTVNLLRPRLNLDFAVFLMRTSYNALDELDCVAMDQFQRDFFLLRQSEYPSYTKQLGGGVVQQGMLQDPYYFDFISFAQYATISREMSQNPPLFFEEQQPDPNQVDNNNDEQKFVKILIRRKDEYINNDQLPELHDRIVGKAILQRLEGMYSNSESGVGSSSNDNNKTLNSIEVYSRPSADVVLASLKLLVQLFVANGFALDGSAAIKSMSKNQQPNNNNNASATDASGATFLLTLRSPATLWSGKSLQRRNSRPANDFLRKAASALLQREGYRMVKSSLQYTATEEITTFQIL